MDDFREDSNKFTTIMNKVTAIKNSNNKKTKNIKKFTGFNKVLKPNSIYSL